MSKAIEFGDANPVAILHLNEEGLEFLANYLPSGDAFTKEVNDVLDEVIKDRHVREETAAEMLEQMSPMMLLVSMVR